jgi:alginate O-acetyltransferase complex protein AlgI
MSTVAISKPAPAVPAIAAWLPLGVLPAVVGWLAASSPAWVLMWWLAISIYAGLKWLTFAYSWDERPVAIGRALGYLFFWPGMDAEQFLYGKSPAMPRFSEQLAAIAKVTCGALLIYFVVPWVASWNAVIAGWAGMTGVVLVLHFGLAQLLSVAWREAGVVAPPIMNRPLFASSITDFWSRRWNLAFRDAAHAFVFRPLVGLIGGRGATMAVFIVSGLIHDAVISLPAGGGIGLPTLYFLIQGIALLMERSRFGRGLGLGRGWFGRLVAIVVIVGPAPILFHQPFVEQVVLPTLAALGAY